MHLSAGSIHLFALTLTLLIEATGMTLWAHLAYPRFWRAIGCSLLVNLLVHTLFWYSQPIFTTDWPVGLYRAELLVVLVEGAIYKRVLSLQGFTPWLLSASLNLCSFFIGLWLWQYLLA